MAFTIFPTHFHFSARPTCCPTIRSNGPNFLWNNQMTQSEKDRHHLMRWWVANKLVIVILDGETAKVPLGSTVEIKKGPDYAFFHQWLGNGIFVSGGDHSLHQVSPINQ
ncbi:hypothetical protein niasHT_029084 [Heterodera trifolii]|uniref:Uncharacterized protein n=1 Tax=Heterodera trifolii TaxID=157864 RepID=A0ABD2KS21_9BILA